MVGELVRSFVRSLVKRVNVGDLYSGRYTSWIDRSRYVEIQSSRCCCDYRYEKFLIRSEYQYDRPAALGPRHSDIVVGTVVGIADSSATTQNLPVQHHPYTHI